MANRLSMRVHLPRPHLAATNGGKPAKHGDIDVVGEKRHRAITKRKASTAGMGTAEVACGVGIVAGAASHANRKDTPFTDLTPKQEPEPTADIAE